MKKPSALLLALLALGLSPALAKAETDPRPALSKQEAQLEKWLARFPEADTNRDGRLTREEALKFREQQKAGAPEKRSNRRSDLPAPTHADLAYGEHERQRFDLWLPEGTEAPLPIHVFFHGGGFVAGDKAGFDPRPFLEAGFAAASGNYRFVDGKENLAPLPMQDAARIIQVIRSRAVEWKIDPHRISVGGSSAGAVISLWIAYHDDLADPGSADPVARQSSRVACITPLNGPTNLNPAWIREHLGGPHHIHGSLPKMFGTADGFESAEVSARIRASNPWDHLSADDPPTLLIYLGKPEPMPLAESVSTGHLIHHPQFGIALKERLDELGIENDLHTGNDPRRNSLVIDWLEKQYSGTE